MIRPRQRKVVIVAEEAGELNQIFGGFPVDKLIHLTPPSHNFDNIQTNPSYYRKQMLQETLAMEQRRPPEYIIEVFADNSSVKDVVRGKPPQF